jgi:hypothetical protein
MADGYEPMDLVTLRIELTAAFERIEGREGQNFNPENPETFPQRRIIYSAFEAPRTVENRVLENIPEPVSPKNLDDDFFEYIRDACI